jgi:hypothetical protein
MLSKTTKNIIFILFLMLTLIACHKHNKNTIDIIPKNKMIDIMFDVHLIEAKININQMKGENPTNLTIEYYNALFKKYNITKAEYEKSIEYYAENPEKFEDIYIQIINKFNSIH